MVAKRGSKAAHILYQVIKAYRPAPYDIFGYDVSGRRQRLIESFVHDAHSKSVDKQYGKELQAICSSNRRGKLLQELRFGLLVNKVFEDLNLSLRSKKLKREIDPSVLKIAKASKHEYEMTHNRSTQHTEVRA